MMVLQVQVPVPGQAKPPEVRQSRPAQQPAFDEQAWPALEQVVAWQVPVDAPPGTTQPRPTQQSADAVQTAPAGWQVDGTVQTPFWQSSEQHSAFAVQP